MKTMQAHAKKLRSDAAECLMLSNLVTEERRHLFARIAEHLNSIALEIETESVTIVPEGPGAVFPKQAEFTDHHAAPADPQPSARSWRQLPWSLFAALILIAGTAFWAINRIETQTFSLSNLLQKTESASRNSNEDLAALFSDERGERKVLREQLSGLIVRLDGLAKELDDLKSLRTGTSAPSSKGTIGQEDASSMEIKPPPVEAKVTRTGTNSALMETPAPEQTLGPSLATANPSSEGSDQVGTIPPTRAELDLRKLTTGPAGCTHFRSFDPVSGTYTTFDGRRRPCR
jgi:BA14K-like protein